MGSLPSDPRQLQAALARKTNQAGAALHHPAPVWQAPTPTFPNSPDTCYHLRLVDHPEVLLTRCPECGEWFPWDGEGAGAFIFR